MQGFIKLQRDIQGTWIHKDPVYFKAWIDILFNVNWESKKVFIGTTQYVCASGESLNSLDTWATIFGKDWDKSKVRRFFKRLTDATLIDTQNERKTTRLKVLNIEGSEDSRHTNETQTDTQMKRKPTPTKELRIKELIKSNLNEATKLAFEEYLLMRTKLKKKFKTSRAIGQRIKRLEKYVVEYGEQKTLACLNATLDNEWLDIKMEYYENSIKKNGQPAKTDSNNSQPLDLEAYLLANTYKPVEIRRMKESKMFDQLTETLKKETFRLSNISKKYKNPTFSTLFIFESLYMHLGKKLGGSNPTRKLESLESWAKTLSSYDQNKGNFREMLKNRNRNLAY
jgi:hypothetical protein